MNEINEERDKEGRVRGRDGEAEDKRRKLERVTVLRICNVIVHGPR